MDTLGLLAAWIGVISFFFAIFVAVVATLVGPMFRTGRAGTSKARAENHSKLLVAEEASATETRVNQILNLLPLYGTFTVTLIAAVGSLILSIQVLDLGPQLLSIMLPFNISSKILTRTTGLITFTLSYLFIFRLAYLSKKLFFHAGPASE